MTSKSGLSALFAARANRRSETAERRRVECELASFTSKAEKAELSAILARNAEEPAGEIYELISESVLAAPGYRAFNAA